MKVEEKTRIIATEVEFMRQTAKHTWMYHKINEYKLTGTILGPYLLIGPTATTY
jgi:hypothetical protein